MKKILSIVLAAVMLISMMAVNVFAEDENVLFEYDCGEGLVKSGWADIFTAEAADFAAALQQEGAKLVVDVTVDASWAQIHVQAGDWKAVNICDLANGVNEITPEHILEELKKVDASFELASIIQACSNCDSNGSITIKSFKVVSSVAPAENTEAPAENTEAPADTTAPAAETSEPADTGIVLALLPMAIAAAAVAASKRK